MNFYCVARKKLFYMIRTRSFLIRLKHIPGMFSNLESTDIFDSCIDLESDAFQRGHKKGEEAGRLEGQMEGHDLGRRYGHMYAAEMGFYHGCCLAWLKIHSSYNENDINSSLRNAGEKLVASLQVDLPLFIFR